MLKAWKLFRIDTYRNKNIIPVLVILSDGIVNVPLERPLSPFTRKRFVNPSQADVIDAAYLLTKDKVRVIVINTDHRPDEHWSKTMSYHLDWFTPVDLLLEVSRITGGRYYGLSERGKLQKVVLTEAIATASTYTTTPS